MLLGKTIDFTRKFGQALQESKVSKIYTALTQGITPNFNPEFYISSDLDCDVIKFENLNELPMRSIIKTIKTGYYNPITKDKTFSTGKPEFTFKDLFE